MNREAAPTRPEPAKWLLIACAIVVGVTLALNYFVRVSNVGWQESKGYVQYYMEERGFLNAVGWIAGATLVIWIVLLLRALSRRHKAGARKQ